MPPSRAQLEAALAELAITPGEIEPLNDPIRNAVYRVVDRTGGVRVLVVPVGDPGVLERRRRGVELSRVTTLPVAPGIEVISTRALGPVALLPWLDGEPAAQSLRRARDGRPVELMRLGEILATLSECQAGLPASQQPWIDEVRHAVETIAKSGIDLGGRVREAWRRIENTPLAIDALERRVVHGDLTTANFLLRRGELVGVLDWELARVDDPLLDWAPLLIDSSRIVRWVSEGYGLERARRLFETGESRRRAAAYALGRCLLQLADVANVARRDGRSAQLVGQVQHTLDRLLADGVDLLLMCALFADPSAPPPQRSIPVSERSAGVPLGNWRERIARPENRAPTTAPAGSDLLAVLGGPQFFARSWDTAPIRCRFPVPAHDWLEVFRTVGPTLAKAARAISCDANGRRNLAPSEIGDAGDIADAAARRLLVLQDAHQYHPLLGAMRATFAAFFGCPVTTGLYLNGADAPGFPEHHDAHHVFALQLVGRKRWFLGPPIVEHAWRRYDFVDRSEHGVRDVIEVGEHDLLYVPLGWRHRAEPSAELSVHITFGVHVPRMLDVFEALLARVGALDARLRAPLVPAPTAGGIAWRVAPSQLALDDLVTPTANWSTATLDVAGCRIASPTPLAPITGRWPIQDGAFVPVSLASGRADLAELAARLCELPEVHSVHLRGSALEGDVPAHVLDLDLVMVTHGEPTDGVRSAARELISQRDLGAPVDLRPVALTALRDGSASPWLRLCLNVRSELLAGPAVWSEPTRIAADETLARALGIESQELWRRTIARLSRDLASRELGAAGDDPTVRWLQKRALRFLGILGLEHLGVFTRHPFGCAELAHHLAPTSAALAETVADELVAGATSRGAIVRAIELGTTLLSTRPTP